MSIMAHLPAPAAPTPRPGGAASATDHPRPRRNTYAALDLGTNNCRLLIARSDGEDGFVVVDAFSRIVRLGEGLGATGRLSDRAMDRAVAALAICAEKLRRRHVSLVRSVATEACRRAANGPAFVARVAAETGLQLEVITAEQEARLAVLGCHALLEPGTGPALIFDIGGGSTELILIEPGAGDLPRVIDWFSAPWGVVSLTESAPHDSTDPAARIAAYAAMRGRVADAFAGFAGRAGGFLSAEPRLLGTSGTVTTLASVHLDLPCYDRRAVDGLVVRSDAMRAISVRLSNLSVAERAQLPCIGGERADLVVAGCAILEEILEIWPATRLGVADRGLREGILRSLMTRERNGHR